MQRIDYLWLSRRCALRPVDSQEILVSDHLPLLVDAIATPADHCSGLEIG